MNLGLSTRGAYFLHYSRYLVSGSCWGVGLLMLGWRPGPNLWFGVRLPWTLADPYIWNKSWRLASRLLMVMGVTVLISWRAFWISAAHLVGLSCLYTVILYRWKYGTWRFWKESGRINFHPVARCPRCGHYQKFESEAELAWRTCEACGGPLLKPQREGKFFALLDHLAGVRYRQTSHQHP